MRRDTEPDIELVAVDPTGDAARHCLERYFADLCEPFGQHVTPDEYPLPPAEDLTPPRGVFLVVQRAGSRSEEQPLGCGVLTTLDEGVGYITRMWVAADARGLGMGRRILDGLEEHARRFGLYTVRLYTHRNLTAAQGLYRRNGYREVAPFFDDPPFADHFFEKQLG